MCLVNGPDAATLYSMWYLVARGIQLKVGGRSVHYLARAAMRPGHLDTTSLVWKYD